MVSRVVVFFLILALSMGARAYLTPLTQEQKLIRHLTANYTRYGKPDAPLPWQPLLIQSRFFPIKLQSLLEKDEALRMSVRIQLSWKDPALVYDSKKFNMTSVIIPGGSLWVPDLQIANSMSDLYGLMRDSRFDFKVYSDGTIWWHPTGNIATRCEILLENFPFDFQRCPIIMESVIYTHKQLNLTLRVDKTPWSRSMYAESGHWNLVNIKARSRLKFVTNSTAFTRVEFWLFLGRKSGYYKLNIIFPCGMLSALQMLTFFLPLESSERVPEATTVLLSVIVFQSMIIQDLPRSSDALPLLCVYIDLLTGISVLSVGEAVLIAYLVSRKHQRRYCSPWAAQILRCVYRMRGEAANPGNFAGSSHSLNSNRDLYTFHNRRASRRQKNGRHPEDRCVHSCDTGPISSVDNIDSNYGYGLVNYGNASVIRRQESKRKGGSRTNESCYSNICRQCISHTKTMVFGSGQAGGDNSSDHNGDQLFAPCKMQGHDSFDYSEGEDHDNDREQGHRIPRLPSRSSCGSRSRRRPVLLAPLARLDMEDDENDIDDRNISLIVNESSSHFLMPVSPAEEMEQPATVTTTSFLSCPPRFPAASSTDQQPNIEKSTFPPSGISSSPSQGIQTLLATPLVTRGRPSLYRRGDDTELIDNVQATFSTMRPRPNSTSVKDRRRLKQASAGSLLLIDWMFLAKIVDYAAFVACLFAITGVPIFLFYIVPPESPDYNLDDVD